MLRIVMSFQQILKMLSNLRSNVNKASVPKIESPAKANPIKTNERYLLVFKLIGEQILYKTTKEKIEKPITLNDVNKL